MDLYNSSCVDISNYDTFLWHNFGSISWCLQSSQVTLICIALYTILIVQFGSTN